MFMIKSPAKGFTLVELTIIMMVFATIATLAITGYLQAQKSGKTAENLKRATEIATAAENYLVLTLPNRRYPTKDPVTKLLVSDDQSFLNLFANEVKNVISLTDDPDHNHKDRLKFFNCLNSAGGIAGIKIAYWDYSESKIKYTGTGRYLDSDLNCF